MQTPDHDRRGQNHRTGAPQTGERFVFYEYCISLIFITLRRPSRVVRLRPGSTGLLRGLPYTIISLLFGWWGLPWGLVYTPLTLRTNLTGGQKIASQDWKRHSGSGNGE
jgi:hypothetical protein